MSVIRQTLFVRRRQRDPGRAPQWALARLNFPADRGAIEALVAACRTGGEKAAGRSLSATGLAAELDGRDGREVVGYLAHRPGCQHLGPAGLVLVAESVGGGGRRFSIAWLLVHPHVRRQGVGTALVDRALEHVRDRGGAICSVETLATWDAAVCFWRRAAERHGDQASRSSEHACGR